MKGTWEQSNGHFWEGRWQGSIHLLGQVLVPQGRGTAGSRVVSHVGRPRSTRLALLTSPLYGADIPGAGRQWG